MMTRYKTWVVCLVGVLALFIGANAVIWKCFTEDILTGKEYYNGGLDRLAYVVGSKYYRKPESRLPRKHIENTEYRGQHVDLVTIGDSFSNIRDNGRDPLYQDWIASLDHLEVLNVQPLPEANELATAVILLNSGYLDKIRPRFVLLETVERDCVDTYGVRLDFHRSGSLRDIEEYFRTASYRYNLPDVGFLNTGNAKFLLNGILYRFSDHAFFSRVYIRDLNAPFFSVPKARRLLFFRDDIANIPLATKENIRLLNENLNRAADLLRKKGMTLYFMPAPDKYDMYSDYIVNNPYPRSVFFELLRGMPKRYVFVDTKAVLAAEIRRGEQDVYYADDTHWSWKAVKKITESLRF